MNELVLALLMAQRDGRIADFVELSSRYLAEAESEPAALLELCTWANMLHRSSPTMSLEVMATLDDIGKGTATVTGVDISDELLDVIESMGPDGFSADAEEIISRFDWRPGSADAIRQMCLAFAVVLSTMELQMGMPGLDERRSPAAARRLAIESARRAVRQERPPSVFDANWDDR